METTTLLPGMDGVEVGFESWGTRIETAAGGVRGETVVERACGAGVAAVGAAGPREEEPPRLRRPDRAQVLMQTCCLEDVLPADHPARSIWAVVERLNLSKFYESLKARGSDPGRSATDPKLLIELWL